MARDITVYKKPDLQFIQTPPAVDVHSPEFDRWCDQAKALCLYEAPLGSEGVVREEWSEPAAKLDLPLLTSVYDRGFHEGIEWSGAALAYVQHELSCLEQYWSEQYRDKPALLNDLHERVECLREAIKIAREHDGVILIA